MFPVHIDHLLTTHMYQAYTYDWVLSISDECAVVSESGMTWSISIYFLLRYAACSLDPAG